MYYHRCQTCNTKILNDVPQAEGRQPQMKVQKFRKYEIKQVNLNEY